MNIVLDLFLTFAKIGLRVDDASAAVVRKQGVQQSVDLLLQFMCHNKPPFYPVSLIIIICFRKNVNADLHDNMNKM